MQIHIYTHWQASDLPRLFLSARGGSLSVGGVVLMLDAVARASSKLSTDVTCQDAVDANLESQTREENKQSHYLSIT